MFDYTTPHLGATLRTDGSCHFSVWSPSANTVQLCLKLPEKRYLPMQKTEQGYWHLTVPDIQAGTPYLYRINGAGEYPDPAARRQNDTVHGASEVVDSRYHWQDSGWFNRSLQDYVIYELHVGTFTQEGTFEAIIPHLDHLKELGITAIEIMPIGQFPGGRNWGYDGVLPYAVQNTYGHPRDLKRLVDACHERGMAVLLDVVYNHLGAEGNYLWQYGPYFTEQYKSPWGASVNFDGEYGDEVRRYFIQNAIYWLDEYHIDGLRLDATHALFDFSAVPFLEDLTASVKAWADRHNRRVYLIAENDRSDVKLLRSRDAGGTGLDGVWLDDLHHALHVLLTGENKGYYSDFTHFSQLAKVMREGFAFSGDYSPFRKRRHGTSSAGVPGYHFVVSTQNHDQVGNRMLGERLSLLTDFAGLKVAAGAVLWSPYLPMLFMGEEYGETAPFLYFISHGDPSLVEAVRKGRKEEFAYFGWQEDPPDPQAESTFERSKLNHDLRHQGRHKTLYEFYKTLLELRKTIPALSNFDKSALDVWGFEHERALFVFRRDNGDDVLIAYNFHTEVAVTLQPPTPEGRWRKRFDSADPRWQAENEPETCSAAARLDSSHRETITLPPKSFALYVRDLPLKPEGA
jgi:maltooligosyltrehalose trehalohydrolase